MINLKELKPVGSTIDRGISFIIYGNPGVGKTTLATTLPPEQTLIVNSEAGDGPLLGKGHIVFELIKFVEDGEFEKTVEDLYKTLRTTDHPFKYVVLDNLSEIENQLLLSITKRRGKEVPTIKEYGDVAFKMKEWVHLYRDLQYKGINVIFNAWEFPIELRSAEGNLLTLILPKVSKSYAPNICGLVDVVGHMEVHEKSGKRWIRFRPNDQFLCKSQFGGIGGANDQSGEPADLMGVIQKLRSHDYGPAVTCRVKETPDNTTKVGRTQTTVVVQSGHDKRGNKSPSRKP